LNILIYALGGGWGHVTRAAGLARALGPAARVRILANSPYLDIVKAAMPELGIEEVSTVQEDPDVLVVDTFPRGLVGELANLLPSLRAWKVLIHRDLKPEYVSWAGLRTFVGDHYDCVLCPGERGALADLPHARFTAPWLVRPPVAVQPGVDVVVCAGGNAGEMPWYGEVAARLARDVSVRCLAPEIPPGCPPELWIRYWPSIDWIAGAGVVVGGGGYNTVNECRALAVPLVVRPWPRKYDRQRLRAKRCPNATIVDTPEEGARAALEALARPRIPPPNFKNGAEEAARWIKNLLDKGGQRGQTHLIGFTLQTRK
jgi:UDP:flavonoid glycosyltransferase YjiC (YdhE family)